MNSKIDAKKAEANLKLSKSAYPIKTFNLSGLQSISSTAPSKCISSFTKVM